MDEPHPRPWRKQYAKTCTANYTRPIYLVAADGRKICAVWGKAVEGEPEATVDLILKAVNTYERAQKLRAAKAKA